MLIKARNQNRNLKAALSQNPKVDQSLNLSQEKKHKKQKLKKVLII